MKIKKLIESKIVEDAENAAEVAAELNPTDKDNTDLNKASTTDMVADMADGAAENGQAIDPEAAAKEAQSVKQAIQGIRNPYGTAKISEATEILQAALDAALDDKEAGWTTDFPNVILYGLAGFGKTAIVEQFCKDHKGFVNYFEVDAKNMDAATVGGIPYPKTDKETGELTQAPVASAYWKDLDKPNTILVLDEFNRANSKVVGSFLTLINNHKLPWYKETKDETTGEVHVETMKKFENILFTVIMYNPASDVFPDVSPFDPAVVNRVIAIHEQTPDKRDFLRVLNNMYSVILNKIGLRPELKDKYQGQLDIATALLTSRMFQFDDANMVRTIYKKQRQGITENYLTYRSLFGVLKACNGTMQGFLKQVKWARFCKETTDMIENTLRSANYTDKIGKGNSPFAQNASTVTPQRSAHNEAEVENILGEFAKNLK